MMDSISWISWSYPAAFVLVASTTGVIIILLSRKDKKTSDSQEQQEDDNTNPEQVKYRDKLVQLPSSQSARVSVPRNFFGDLQEKLQATKTSLMHRSSRYLANNQSTSPNVQKSAPTHKKNRKLIDPDGKRFPKFRNTVIFFPDVNLLYHDSHKEVFEYLQAYPEEPTAQLVRLLKSAQSRLQLCLYRLSFFPLAKVLINKFQLGKGKLKSIPVQIIVDSDVYDDVSSRNRILEDLQELGIEVRVKKSRCHMHHKFVIIDETLVLTGSLNWTKNALSRNEEDVIVTMDQGHVQKYMDRFEVLWNESTPGVVRKMSSHFYKIYEKD